MSSSPDQPTLGPVLLRGAVATERVSPARLDSDLRSNPYVRMDGADPRLVDPSLARAFDDLAGAVRAAAQSAGYASGYTSGYAAAVATVRQEAQLAEAARDVARAADAQALAAVLSSLRRAVSELASRRAPLICELSELLAPAAVLLAGAVLGREIAMSENPGLDAVIRAMSCVPDDDDVVVRLHPEDAKLLDASGALEQIPGSAGRTVRVVADSTVARGDALADSVDVHVDACVGAALDRAAEVLAP